MNVENEEDELADTDDGKDANEGKDGKLSFSF